MFAVIKTGGKQYRVQEGIVYKMEKLEGDVGSIATFNDVMMIGKNGEETVIGTPLIDNALVEAEIVEQMRDKKVIIFKKQRRQHYRRKNGHRQYVTLVKVTKIKA